MAVVRANPDVRGCKRRYVSKQLPLQSGGHCLSVGDRQYAVQSNIEFSVQPVPEPASANIENAANAGHVRRGVAHLGDNLRLECRRAFA